MQGKILKVSSNDLYGNVDDRKIVVFAAFNHLKYMNKYAIFCFQDEYNKKILYYGTVHLKNDSLVIFSVNETVKGYIDEFVNQYLNNNVNSQEYQILDISNIDKAELVGCNQEEFLELNELDRLSIPKVSVNKKERTGSRKPIFLYVLLVVLIMMLVGITYFYFNHEKFGVVLKTLYCEKNDYNQRMDMDYVSNLTAKFDSDEKLKTIDIVDIYTFSNSRKYQKFKTGNKQDEYFNIEGTYKYDDENLQLKVMYKEKSIIQKLDEMKVHLSKEGYTCNERTSEE